MLRVPRSLDRDVRSGDGDRGPVRGGRLRQRGGDERRELLRIHEEQAYRPAGAAPGDRSAAGRRRNVGGDVENGRMPSPTIRAASLVAVLAAASLGLAGCLDNAFPTQPASSAPPQGIASGEPTPSRTPSASPSPTPSATPSAAAATPLSLPCEQLIPLQALYDLNPNYALVPTTSTASGSLAASALADKGTACQVVHTSSGARATITISQPSPAALAADLATAKKSPSETQVDAATGATIATRYGSASAWQSFTALHRYTAESGSDFNPDDLTAILGIAMVAQG